MRRFGRRAPDGPPADVLAAAGVRAGEVLGCARGDDGTWLLGTRGRLVVASPSADAESLPWEEVEDAGWDRDAEAVRVRALAPYGEPRREWRVVVGDTEPALFLQLLRERVTASVVVQRKATVRGKRGVVVACRRSPLGGPLRYDVAFDPGVEPDDPEVRRLAEDLLARVRAELGEVADGPGADPAW